MLLPSVAHVMFRIKSRSCSEKKEFLIVMHGCPQVEVKIPGGTGTVESARSRKKG